MALALRHQFDIESNVLECVEDFKNLVRMLSMHNNDGPVVRAQMGKAWSSWNRIVRVLNGENASPCVCSKFFKSILQSVLLYCRETWNIVPALLARLEGLQLRCAYEIKKANWPKRGPGGSWVYPRMEDVMK